MSSCRRCGAKIPENSRFCPVCRTPVRTGLERARIGQIGQDLWILRTTAYVVDVITIQLSLSLILSLFTAIPLFFFRTQAFFSLPSFLIGILSVIYFTLMEYFYGFTIGKRFMRVRVGSLRRRLPTLEMIFIRNLSKIHWILLLIDLILGMLTQGDPNQKFSDRYAGTTVRSTLT